MNVTEEKDTKHKNKDKIQYNNKHSEKQQKEYSQEYSNKKIRLHY